MAAEALLEQGNCSGEHLIQDFQRKSFHFFSASRLYVEYARPIAPHNSCSFHAGKLYGTKQVTDAYLLGLAVQEGLILVTMDKGIVHLAGEHQNHVLRLQ